MKKYISLTAFGLCLSVSVYSQEIHLQKDNIDKVIASMTIEEKAQLLVGKQNPLFVDGVYMGGAGNLLPGGAGATNEITRLGIPYTIMTDGPSGVHINPTRPNDSRTYYATAFPGGSAMASSWNLELMEEVGRALGNEELEYGGDVLLGPGMNIHRNPLCGRNFEYFSEDPFLTGWMAAAYVNGVQSQGVGACIKHFAANNQETNRNENDSRVSQRALRDIYLKGFEIAVKASNPWTVMASYNKLNGEYTQASEELLTTLLRKEWGYEGMVMTDWTQRRNTIKQITAGTDLLEPGMQQQCQDLIDGVKNGQISMTQLDEAVRHMLNYIVKTPHFNKYKASSQPDLKKHAQICLEAARECMILLKNEDQTLPLKPQGRKIALFGINSYDLLSGGTGSGDVNKAYEITLADGLKSMGNVLNPELEKLYVHYKDFVKQSYLVDPNHPFIIGKEKIPELQLEEGTILKQAKEADVAILCIGRNAGEESDRKRANDFDLTDTERSIMGLISDAFHQKGKKVVVVLNIGGVMETSSWSTLADAILLAWQPGQEGGRAMADVLSGAVTPSGKLPMTFPVNYMDHLSSQNFPVYEEPQEPFKFSMEGKENFDYTDYQEGIYVGYRYFDTQHKAVSYPFGFGLSYTQFSYENTQIKPQTDGFKVYVTVKNTGKHDGKETVQLYVTAPAGKLDKPAIELKGFAKTSLLKPGEAETICIEVKNENLASFDEDKSMWVADAGRYKISIASSSRDIRQVVTYLLKKEYGKAVENILGKKQ